MPYDQMMNKYQRIFGNDITKIYEQVTQGNAVEATKSIINSSYLRDILNKVSTTSGKSASLDKLLGKDNASLVNMMKYFGSGDKLNEFTNKLDETLENMKNITDSDVESYVEENAQLTILEKMQNDLSLFVNGINWKYTTGLANMAFIALSAGAIFKGISSLTSLIGQINTAGGPIKLLTSKLGLGSKLADSTKIAGEGVEALNSGNSKVGSILGGIGAVGRRYFISS